MTGGFSRPLLAAVIGASLIAPADSASGDGRLSIYRGDSSVVVGRGSATTMLDTLPTVRIFARHPRPEYAPLAAVPVPLPRPGTTVVNADDAEFWRAAGAGDANGAQHEYQRLTASLTPWPASAAAKAVLDQLSFDAALSGAVDRRDWQRVAALQRDFPAQFTCARIGNLWTAAEAHRQRGDMIALAALYTTIVETCDRDDPILAVQRGVDHLPPDLATPLLARAANSGDVAVAAAAAGLRYNVVRTAVIAAFHAGDDPAVRHLTQTNSTDITDHRDADLALFAAWSAERSAAFDLAAGWFARALIWQPSPAAANGVVEAALRDGDFDTAERVVADHLAGTPDGSRVAARIVSARAVGHANAGDDAAVVALARQARRDNSADASILILAGYANLRLGEPTAAADDFAAAAAAGAGAPARLGHARARIALGDLDGAETLITDILPDAEAVAIAADIDMRRANTAFDAHDYRAALTHAQGAQRSPDLALAGLELEAWSLFHLQRYGVAAELFENLYRVTPSEAITDGLFTSLTRINRPARLRRIAQETEGPLDRRLQWQGVID